MNLIATREEKKMRALVGIMMSSVLISTTAIAASDEQIDILPQLPEGKAWRSATGLEI